MEEAGAGEAIIALSSRTGVLVGGGGRSQAFLTKITFKFTCTMYALLMYMKKVPDCVEE